MIVMTKILEFIKKASEHKVPYKVSGNGVAHVKAADILKTREAQQQIKAAKAVVSRRQR